MPCVSGAVLLLRVVVEARQVFEANETCLPGAMMCSLTENAFHTEVKISSRIFVKGETPV